MMEKVYNQFWAKFHELQHFELISNGSDFKIENTKQVLLRAAYKNFTLQYTYPKQVLYLRIKSTWWEYKRKYKIEHRIGTGCFRRWLKQQPYFIGNCPNTEFNSKPLTWSAVVIDLEILEATENIRLYIPTVHKPIVCYPTTFNLLRS